MQNLIVTRDPHILSGRPTVFGHRRSVLDILWGVYSDGLHEYNIYHDINIEYSTLLDIVDYCRAAKCREGNTLPFCSQCVLDNLELINIDNSEPTSVIQKAALETLGVDHIQYMEHIRDDNTSYVDHAIGLIGWMIADELHATLTQ